MASPPQPASLALPHQRPALALPGHQQQSYRTQTSPIPSYSSAPTLAHPLRQTSFPPTSLEAQHAAAEAAEEAAAQRLQQYSPSQASPGRNAGFNDADGESRAGLEDEFSDSEIVSAISGPVGSTSFSLGGGEIRGDGSRKRKRGGDKHGQGRGRGRQPKKAQSLSQSAARASSASLANGSSHRGATQEADNEASSSGSDDSDDDAQTRGAGGGVDGRAGGGRAAAWEGAQLTLEDREADKSARAKFREYMEHLDALPLTSTAPARTAFTTHDMSERFDVYTRAKIRTADLKKFINQTLSQSVPGGVVTVVSSYVKMFAGGIVEEARKVQGEWMAAEARRADGEPNEVFRKLQRSQVEDDVDGHDDGGETIAENTSRPPSSSPKPATTEPAKSDAVDEIHPGGAGSLQSSILEYDRGPLQPDHLREALRRYKKSRAGGSVGFTGLSLEGKEVAASRMGGKRLFR